MFIQVRVRLGLPRGLLHALLTGHQKELERRCSNASIVLRCLVCERRIDKRGQDDCISVPGTAQTMSANDPYDLQRFVDAQSHCFEQVCRELSEGHKQSHWMWFIFPQLKGLGHSALAKRYAISSHEVDAYLEHPILGSRLRHCTQLVMLVEGRSINQIFETPDDLKFRSSMTLFASTASENKIFKDALQKYFAGKPDQFTIDRL